MSGVTVRVVDGAEGGWREAWVAGVETGAPAASTLSVTDTHGPAGSPISLGIAAALTDTDGSEALGIQVANVPTGAVLSGGVNDRKSVGSGTGGGLGGRRILKKQTVTSTSPQVDD